MKGLTGWGWYSLWDSLCPSVTTPRGANNALDDINKKSLKSLGGTEWQILLITLQKNSVCNASHPCFVTNEEVLFPLLLCPYSGVSADLCRVTGGVLGIHWSSIISMGWHPLANGQGGATCWESCCINPSCNAVWSLGGHCVLLSCSRKKGCPISFLPQPHQESLGLLQLLSKV